MAVRSRRLFGPALTSATGTGALVYTVPVGRTAVIRTLVIVNWSATAGTLVVAYAPDDDATHQLWRAASLAAGATVVLPGPIILNPADQLRVRVDPAAATCNVYGFGTLLLGSPD